MSNESTLGNHGRRIREENIVFKILRLLAEEQLITLEEEIKSKEIFRKEVAK